MHQIRWFRGLVCGEGASEATPLCASTKCSESDASRSLARKSTNRLSDRTSRSAEEVCCKPMWYGNRIGVKYVISFVSNVKLKTWSSTGVFLAYNRLTQHANKRHTSLEVERLGTEASIMASTKDICLYASKLHADGTTTVVVMVGCRTVI